MHIPSAKKKRPDYWVICWLQHLLPFIQDLNTFFICDKYYIRIITDLFLIVLILQSDTIFLQSTKCIKNINLIISLLCMLVA